MNNNERPLISILEPMKDTRTVIVCKENESITSRIEKNKYTMSLFYDPATIVAREVYDDSARKTIVMVKDEKVSDFKAVTQRLINMLKNGYIKGRISELHYYDLIAGYLVTSHLDKPADKEIIKAMHKIGKIPGDKYGYFKCVLLNDIWKHGEIHIDISGNFYWYDTVKEQYYHDDCGLIDYPSLTMPICELNKKYMDVIKGKRPMSDIDKDYLPSLFLDFAKSICKIENDNYERGIML